MEADHEPKLARFLPWLQVNGVELRGCNIRYCGSVKGFGIYSAEKSSNGVLLVVPLDLAITPMRVLQDPDLGPRCRAMFEEGEVDDRFLMILFLTVEHLRKNSTWKPYLDMLPVTFGSSVWFTEEELSELKGTTLYRATKLQKEKLQEVFNDKVKHLVGELLHGNMESELFFEDFLWANSIFWTRALNIPLPRCYVFPESVGEQEISSSGHNKGMEASLGQISAERSRNFTDESSEPAKEDAEAMSAATQGDTIWVEGLVPGIDFCNHGLKATATWEVDERGSITGVPCSMYLLSAEDRGLQDEREISISYGNKGNEELLYLYGFVLENNPDDYVMVHYPIDAFQNDPLADSKAQLLQIQRAEMRCLLPRSLLEHGFFSRVASSDEKKKKPISEFCNYSWSGQRKVPSYLKQLVFPEDFLSALRIVAMKEDELLQVSSFLEELVGSGADEQPSDSDVRAAVWEACGDAGALQLLVDLLQVKKMELEEGSGTEASDDEILEKVCISEILEENASANIECPNEKKMSRNRWSAIVYRRGQKQLTRLFLKEAEHALQLCLTELQ